MFPYQSFKILDEIIISKTNLKINKNVGGVT